MVYLYKSLQLNLGGKEMKKKVISMVLSGMMIMSLAACGETAADHC